MKKKYRIKQWDQMEKEFGLDSSGDIACEGSFVTEMRSACGTIIEHDFNQNPFTIHIDFEPWCISPDMVEEVEEVEEEEPSKKITYTHAGLGRIVEERTQIDLQETIQKIHAIYMPDQLEQYKILVENIYREARTNVACDQNICDMINEFNERLES